MDKSSALLTQTLTALATGESISSDAWSLLHQIELSDRQRAQAFGLTEATVKPAIEQRAIAFQVVYPTVKRIGERLFGDFTHQLPTLWLLWLPLAQRLIEQRQAKGRPFIQGILGGQGTGKTTLGLILKTMLQRLGYQTLTWSLDDLYKTYRHRQQLQQQEPALIWRGPPGTHDVELGVEVLDQLRQPTSDKPVLVPRFDKSLQNGLGDRIAPESVTGIDIVLFEGWFVGAKPASPQVFEQPPAPILTDADRTFALRNNERLQAYLPLWQRLDSLWVLYVPDYQLSKQWRKQAEHQMKASGKAGLSDAAIDEFVEYFWKALHPEIFISPTLQDADLVLEINAYHAPTKVYQLNPI